MAAMTIDTWKLVLDLAALTLCGVTALYVARKRRARKLPAAVPSHDEEEIERIVRRTFYRWVRQNGLDARRRPAESVRPLSRPDEKVPGGPAEGKTARTAPGRGRADGVIRIPPPAEGAPNATSLKIYRFAESGMSVQKIAEKLEMPRCEVELISKFRPRDGGSRTGRLQDDGTYIA